MPSFLSQLDIFLSPFQYFLFSSLFDSNLITIQVEIVSRIRITGTFYRGIVFVVDSVSITKDSQECAEYVFEKPCLCMFHSWLLEQKQCQSLFFMKISAVFSYEKQSFLIAKTVVLYV